MQLVNKNYRTIKRFHSDLKNRTDRYRTMRQQAIPSLSVYVALVWISVFPNPLFSAESTSPEQAKKTADSYFRDQVAPFVKKYCIECHQNRRPTEAGLSFNPILDSPGDSAFSETWKKSAARVMAHDMPPDGVEQPSDEERLMFQGWLQQAKYLSPKDPGSFVIRRLTKTEYANTLRDLFEVSTDVADSLPDEVAGEGYMNSLSPLQIEQYLLISEEVLRRVFPQDDEKILQSHQRLFQQAPPSPNDADQTLQHILNSFAKKAFRRPLNANEQATLLDVFELGTTNNLSYIDSIKLVLKAIMVSPQFLFITPADFPESDAKIIPLDDYQLASRLSYLLWLTLPDAELMDLADQGTLHNPAILESQISRLISDPKSAALFDGFGAQWLGIQDLQTKTFDAEKFPQIDTNYRRAMYMEASLFFQSVIRENLSTRDLLDSDYTFINGSLAGIYGKSDTITGEEMQRVKLDDPNRGGIISMPAVLACTSFPDRTSPVIRGVWVLEKILGQHVPSAPPDVPALGKPEGTTSQTLTLRELTERHRSDPVCANCHRLLDPIGFGLENYDAIGQWRSKDENGRPIDPSGTLPDGSSFNQPSDLKQLLKMRNHEFARNLTERLMAYALCRRLEGYDAIVIDELMQSIADDDYRIQTIIRSVVTSYPFTHRKIE